MASDNLITELKKARVTAIYGKKRHYNAADRKRKMHQRIMFGVLFLNIVTGSVFFADIKEGLWPQVPALLTLVSALLIGTAEFLGFGKDSPQHTAIGDRYLQFGRNCDHCIALYRDGHINDSEFKVRAGELNAALSEIDNTGSKYPTNSCDYKKSREGVKDGEEQFTPEELG